MLRFNTSLVLALGAAIAAGLASYLTVRVARSIAVGVAVLLALSSLISVVRDAADNAALRSESPHLRLERKP
ncbi:MAG TPA: hypothetical protein VE174_14150 [Actinomycetota bacterium]|nr:hypothetical protein [Actinomycetota bacterium]